MSVMNDQDDQFREFVRSCLSLPIIKLEELQETIDELRETNFDDDEKNKLKEEFMDYIQQLWMDGIYPPQTWCWQSYKLNSTPTLGIIVEPYEM